MSQPLRLAYISIVIALQEARLAASSSWGLGPASVPPWARGSSAVTRCAADLDVVLQGAAGAARDALIFSSLPWNSSGESSSAKRAMAYTASEARLR